MIKSAANSMDVLLADSNSASIVKTEDDEPKFKVTFEDRFDDETSDDLFRE